MADWHPIMNAAERQVGTWLMVGPLNRPYGTITIVRRGQECGYRATAIEGQSAQIIGYYRTLRAAADAAHGRFVSTRGPHGKPAAGWLPAAEVEVRDMARNRVQRR